MTDRYFNVIRQRISDTVENNFMSLSGEEKVWNKSRTNLEFQPASAQSPASIESMEDHPHVHPPVKEAEVNAQQHTDEREALLVKKPKTFKEEPLFKMPETLDAQEEKTPKNTAQERVDVDRLTINVSNIKSPVLKKIIQQFRAK